MKKSSEKKMLRRIGFVLLGLIVFRAAFDVKTYFFGSTIVVPGKSYDYLLRLPKGHHDFSPPRPLIVFLHGAGEIDSPAGFLRYHDPYRYVADRISGEEFPFLVVCPAAGENRWRPKEVVALLDELLANQVRYRIDPDRIYLTGISMGAYGAWETACAYPVRFAAIVPLAGGCDDRNLENLLQVPIWAFHGEDDRVIPPQKSEQVVDRLREWNHGDVRLTILPGEGHGIARTVYSECELYRWLLKHRRFEEHRTPDRTSADRAGSL